MEVLSVERRRYRGMSDAAHALYLPAAQVSMPQYDTSCLDRVLRLSRIISPLCIVGWTSQSLLLVHREMAQSQMHGDDQMSECTQLPQGFYRQRYDATVPLFTYRRLGTIVPTYPTSYY